MIDVFVCVCVCCVDMSALRSSPWMTIIAVAVTIFVLIGIAVICAIFIHYCTCRSCFTGARKLSVLTSNYIAVPRRGSRKKTFGGLAPKFSHPLPFSLPLSLPLPWPINFPSHPCPLPLPSFHYPLPPLSFFPIPSFPSLFLFPSPPFPPLRNRPLKSS